MLRMIICEDEKVERELLQQWINEWGIVAQKKVEIISFENSEQFLFYWEERQDIDVLLLDIEMGGMDGMSLAKKIRQVDPSVPIIFTTGLCDRISEGYDVEALHYLIKPLDKKRLFACLDKAIQREIKRGDKLICDTLTGIRRIDVRDIWYIEAAKHHSLIKVEKELIEVKTSFNELEQLHSLCFLLKIHRSYYVNLQYVAKLEKNQLQLDDGHYLPISRRLIKNVTQAFITYYGQKDQ